jgi:LacI family transcriptional regulator
MSLSRSTAQDIARAAGVSIMTVSRAINNQPGVGEKTRKRIMEIAEEYNYRPSRLARGLASRRNTNIGVVIPDIANPFFAILAKAAMDLARASDLNAFIMNTDENPVMELAAFDSLLEEQIDGVIISGSRLPLRRLETALKRFKYPVLVNSDLRAPGIENVDVDDKAAIIKAVHHLVQSGRRRIGFIAGPKESSSSRRRLAGLHAGFELGGLAFDPNAVENCIPDIDGGARAIIALTERNPSLDAVIAYNDITAIGAIRGLAKLGRRVPDDLAVVGFDDVPYASLVRPSLTTLHIDIPALGRQAMKILLDLRGNRPLQAPMPILAELIVRESA